MHNSFYCRLLNIWHIHLRTMWKLVLVISFASLYFSCNNYRPPVPVIKQYVKITDLNRDTVVAISNQKLATTAEISFVESLSDTALVRISADTLFSKHGAVFLLPIKNPPLMFLSGLSGDSLFIKYEPLKHPISGELTIEITFQN